MLFFTISAGMSQVQKAQASSGAREHASMEEF